MVLAGCSMIRSVRYCGRKGLLSWQAHRWRRRRALRSWRKSTCVVIRVLLKQADDLALLRFSKR